MGYGEGGGSPAIQSHAVSSKFAIKFSSKFVRAAAARPPERILLPLHPEPDPEHFPRVLAHSGGDFAQARVVGSGV